ncbi:hypothetical protein GEX85_12515 [Salmonella enterica]|nr:hypothetical protein [Salmonella enterica]
MKKQLIVLNIIFSGMLYSQVSNAEQLSFSSEKDYNIAKSEFIKTTNIFENKNEPKILYKEYSNFQYSDADYLTDKNFFIEATEKKYSIQDSSSNKTSSTYALETISLDEYLSQYIKYKDINEFKKNQDPTKKRKFTYMNEYYAMKYSTLSPEISDNINYILNKEGFISFYLDKQKTDKVFLADDWYKAIKENDINAYNKYKESDKEFLKFVQSIQNGTISEVEQRKFFKILRFYKDYVF